MTTPTHSAQGHTATPWKVLPDDPTRIVTPKAEAFMKRNHYLAGAPFIAECNDDFSTNAQHDEAKRTGTYHRIRDEARAKANAALIVRAVNSHAALVRIANLAVQMVESPTPALSPEVLAGYARAALQQAAKP